MSRRFRVLLRIELMTYLAGILISFVCDLSLLLPMRCGIDTLLPR
jgi:hypothetical protein